ncbi:MAG: GntR family transcriptional regulator [Chlamydiae bacterium CG10_big_fil_rev_8_21_14_0_10_35_9]|nr:MAG: GntR family transcriptional regulator [Chlamydiae bacterium CG10_big_fil_rev_8_21_14_0_10_35_9]
MENKIQRKFVREEAYLKIRNWILEGTLAPKEKLRDKELAAELGVSRTPVREALLRLEEEGLVQTKPNSSTFVSSIDFHNAFHLYSIVWTLEKLALNQAFGSITEFHIQNMIQANEEFLKQMQVNNRLKALDADYDFHTTYVKLSENTELEKMISEIKRKLKRLDLYYFNKINNAELSYEEHKHIIEALQKKDLNAALSSVEKNWKSSFARFEI